MKLLITVWKNFQQELLNSLDKLDSDQQLDKLVPLNRSSDHAWWSPRSVFLNKQKKVQDLIIFDFLVTPKEENHVIYEWVSIGGN